jgi:60 kDa SS-A/Ro ribonucleoprotein
MPHYLSGKSTRETAQSEPILGAGQVENSAGGHAWQIDHWAQLERFLILGSEGGTYYISQQKLTDENVESLSKCVDEDPERALKIVVEVSASKRAPKNDAALFALAYIMGVAPVETRRLAAERLPAVARTGTHLFMFMEFMTQFRGWGPVARRAVRNWYLSKDANSIAYQAVKYRQRNQWTHLRALRLSHPVTTHLPKDSVFAWIAGKFPAADNPGALPRVIEGFEKAQKAESPRDAAVLVKQYGLPWEALPSHFLDSSLVWEALLENMPMTAMIRNLNKMTKVGLLKPLGEHTQTVCERLDSEMVKKAGVHPLNVLVALRTYAGGHGFRGNLEWDPVTEVVDALDAAFYKAFGNVDPMVGTSVLAVDVSASMDDPYFGQYGRKSPSAKWLGDRNLTPREVAAAMALITAATSKRTVVVTFDIAMQQMPISPRMRLTEVTMLMKRHRGGGTDCALPMLEANKQKMPVDNFVIYTDSETWSGVIHPSQALQRHREHFNPNAKLAVVAMTSNGFSIADPRDKGMMDFVGFDTAAPQLLADFSKQGV